MVDVCFSKPEVVISHKLIMLTTDVDEIWFLKIDFDFLKARISTNTKPEVILSKRLRRRHLEKSIRRYISAICDRE